MNQETSSLQKGRKTAIDRTLGLVEDDLSTLVFRGEREPEIGFLLRDRRQPKLERETEGKYRSMDRSIDDSNGGYTYIDL